jgi:type IV secretory pathway TrbD component
MTDSFLLVVAPWIIFGVCLTLLCIRLLRARARRGDKRVRP